MSAQMDERTDSIEHLDHEVSCDSIFHGDGPRPRADFWVDVHGCAENLFCAACNVEEKRVVDEGVQNGKELCCMHCFKPIWTYSDCYTKVVPL